MDFAISLQFHQDGALLVVAGEVDVATAPVLETGLVSAVDASGSVSVDLSQLGFIDASGLGALVAGHRYATGRRTVLRLVHVPDHLTRLLTITDLGGLLLGPIPR